MTIKSLKQKQIKGNQTEMKKKKKIKERNKTKHKKMLS